MNKLLIALNIIVIAMLIVACGYLGMQYFNTQKQLEKIKTSVALNSKIISLDKLFVAKILAAKGAIPAGDRLELENAVSDTNDSDIIAAWGKFLASATEAEAQDSALNLLMIFSNKITY